MGNEVNIIIRAKSMQGQGFAQADREMQAFVKNAKHHTEFLRKTFATIGVALLGIGGAVVAFAKKALEAYSEEERAVRRLESAHRAFGEEVTNTVAAEVALAKAIQDETGVAKDKTITSMAALRMYGVQTSSLEECAKAVIALTYAGMDEEGAAKAVAGAYEGNYSKLQKFIPALKMATSEAEKATIVNEFLTRNYSAQKEQVNTLSGAWTSFKNTTQEAMETVGKNLSESGALQNALHAISSVVEAVSESFHKWVIGGGLQYTLATVYGTIVKIGEKIWDIENAGLNARLAMHSQKEIETVLRKERAIEQEEHPKSGVKIHTEGGLSLTKSEKSLLADVHAREAEERIREKNKAFQDDLLLPEELRKKKTQGPYAKQTSPYGPPGGPGGDNLNISGMGRNAAALSNHQQAMEFIKAEAAQDLRAEQERHKAAKAKLVDDLALAAEEKEHLARVKTIREGAHDSFAAEEKSHRAELKKAHGADDDGAEGPIETSEKSERALDAIIEEGRAWDEIDDKRRQAIKHVQQEKKRNAEEIAAVNRREQEKELQRAEQEMQRELHHAQELARMHVSEYMARERSEAQWKKIQSGEESKARRLSGPIRIGGGIHGRAHGNVHRMGGPITGLGGTKNAKDAAWMHAHGVVAGAGKAVPKLQQGIKLNQDQRDKLAVDGAKSMADLLTEQKQINKKLGELLVVR